MHFGTEDLARTQVAEGPDPLWEVLLSLHLLQSHDGPLVFDRWRQRTLPRLGRQERSLATLAPPRGYSPDFLTPARSAAGLEPGLDAVRGTTASRLRTDIGQFARTRRVPPWARDLRADGLRRLAGAMRTYHATALAPYWSQIRSDAEVDRQVRLRHALGGGVEQLFTTLHPALRWNPPVLELRGVRGVRDIHLDGRGLRLIPSFFCWRAPIMLRDPALPPVLVYPIEHTLGWADTDGPPKAPADRQPCAALLGRTRAAALEVIAAGCTSTELARCLNVSPATATHHTAILREAGLITSHRSGGVVHHTLRSLGAALLGGGVGEHA
ncbi:ArsR/SmtB family transcription factor [Streptomyces sp. NPDC050161]|uniref:ArsR/SmtB family transcription factor n=1 Tax=Streptomyces sp. NPDC050161 TaxID=3365604 RepID=UPI003794DDF4